MSEYVLELRAITKTFPGVKALDHVHFQLRAGEIHALMGENGAGKSTFIKVITGVHQPDQGEIYVNGNKVVFNNPNDAKKYRYCCHLSACDLLSRSKCDGKHFHGS